jgi:hypothetical protein
VVEHVLESRACTGCGHVTTAAPPAGVNAPVQYGPSVRAAAVYLRVRHHLPWQRCALLLADLLGTAVTAAALREWTARAAMLVAGFTAVVRKRITDAPVAGFDETGARVAGRTRWIHTAVTDTFTAYLLHDKRGTVAFDAMGVLPAFTGTAVHDGWKPYKTYTGVVHALCNAHHLRELAGITQGDPVGQAWAANLAALLRTVWNDRKQRQAEGATAFTPDKLTAYQERYHQVIEAGHAANPPSQGRRRTRAQNLLHRLDTERDQVLRFAADWRVPFDNNTAEQAIRMAKIQLNVSHGWRTIQGARRFLALRSYLETAKKHDLDLHDALARLFDGRGTWLPAPR